MSSCGQQRGSSPRNEVIMEWIEVPIPSAIASGPAPQILHYLKVNDKWAVYIIEVSTDDEGAAFMGPMGPILGRAKWFIVVDGSEVAAGVLKNLKSAKNVSMTVLNSLMEGPEPDTVSGNPGIIVGGKGSGN